MKIIYIRPNIGSKKSTSALEPLVFGILHALTPPEIEQKLIDDCIENINFDEKADIVAISVGTYSAKRAYYIAEKFKSHGATIVLGGFHVSILPEEGLKHSDCVVIGDAEDVWQQLITDFQNKRLKPFYKSTNNKQILKTQINRNIFKNKKYFKVNLVQVGRGCIHNCDFCSIKAFYANSKSIRKIDDVIEEIDSLNNRKILFVDDNLYYGKKHFQDFIKQIAPKKKQWACQISIDIAKDVSMVAEMKKAGCFMVLIGIETFNEKNLQQMNKQWSLNQIMYAKAIDVFHTYGILVYASFIFGYDHDTTENLIQTVNFSIENKLFLANFNLLYPMPGTPLYKRLSEEKRLTSAQWWLDDDIYYGKINFIPANYSPIEMETKYFESKKKFISILSILKRMLNFRANSSSFNKFMIFLALNIINRKEIIRKQKQKLG